MSGACSLHVVDETVITGSRLKIPRDNTAVKMPLPLRKTPFSVGVVDEALIETQDGATLSDALANISGVGVHTNFGVHDLFYLRGFDSLGNGLVLSDGAPSPKPPSTSSTMSTASKRSKAPAPSSTAATRSRAPSTSSANGPTPRVISPASTPP